MSIHLADELSVLFKNIDAEKLNQDLRLRSQIDANGMSTLYVKTILHLQQQQLAYDVKSQLHSLQASISHYFAQNFQFDVD